ncbi:hypothetical protein BD413DRAFT_451975, partial [Trametes elegans]
MWPEDLNGICASDNADQNERVTQATETILLAQKHQPPELFKAAYYHLLRTPAFGEDLAVYEHAETSGAPDHDAALLRHESDADKDAAPPARLAASGFVRLVRAR